jgi:hypothetical protein
MVEMEAQAPQSVVRKVGRFIINVKEDLEKVHEKNPEFHPIEICGEPISDTVLRNRRGK